MRNAIIAVALFSVTQISFARVGNLTCSFTEPFFTLQYTESTGTLVIEEPNWDTVGPPTVTRVLETNLELTVEPNYGKNVRLTLAKPQSKKVLLEGYLDFKGSDSMSDFQYPISVVFHSKDYGTQQGGCTTEALDAIDQTTIEPQAEQFLKDVNQAIELCYARAAGTWTSDPSEYQDTNTVFYTLYSQEFVPGEPGNVSQVFSTGENELLFEVLGQSRTPPEDGADLNHNIQKKFEYCHMYGKFLQKRFIKD